MKDGFRGTNYCNYYINDTKVKHRFKRKISIFDIGLLLLEAALITGTIFGIVNWCIKFNMLCGG